MTATRRRRATAPRVLVRREHPVARVLALVGLVVLWELLTRTGWVPALFLPSPLGVLGGRRGHGCARGELVGARGRPASSGSLPASRSARSRGVAVGVAVGVFSLAEAVGTPLIAATFPIPKIALLPLLILWLGIGEASKVAVIALGVFFPMAINTYAGVRQADPLLHAGRGELRGGAVERDPQGHAALGAADGLRRPQARRGHRAAPARRRRDDRGRARASASSCSTPGT